VLIAGAGPVGLLLAAELSRDDVDVLLIDRLPERSFFARRLESRPAHWRSSTISASSRTRSIPVYG